MSTDTPRIVDPKKITEDDLPLIVLSDNLRSFVPWIIKAHTSGNYSHSMWMYKPGFFASQSVKGYISDPVESYDKEYIRLKFWKIKNLKHSEKVIILDDIMRDLNLPWWQRRYDFLGVISHYLNIPWLNNPKTYYCSERVVEALNEIGFEMYEHPSPADLDRAFKENPRMEVFGYWFEG